MHEGVLINLTGSSFIATTVSQVTNPNTFLLGDSIIAGLARYQIIWKKYCVSLNAVNLCIGGDRVENVLWPAISLPLPSFIQNIVVQCRTNNISTDSP